MAPRTKPAAAADPTGGSDSEDDLLATTTTAAASKRTTAKVPKGKSAARRVSANKATTKRKAAPKPPRAALKDRTNLPDGNETEEVDAFDDEDMAVKPKAKRAKTMATTTTTTTTRKNAKAGLQAVEGDCAKKPAAKRGRQAKRAPSPEPMVTIPETQPEPEVMDDVEQSIEVDADHVYDIEKQPTPQQTSQYVQRALPVGLQPLQPRPSARTAPVQPVFPPLRERSGSASAAERRGGDPELRRQLNDLTKRYENLHMKYEGLQEIGKRDADSNFEKYKRAADQKAKEANEVIASLRGEIAKVRKQSSAVSSESVGLQKQLAVLTTANEKLTAGRNEFKEKLQASQNEVKTLEAKLHTARQQVSTSAIEVTKAQEAAAKKHNSSISVNIGEAQKEAKMKENLYADLTGLLISSVKCSEGEDIFNCIQTGRNGCE